ncbi:hypothetical protein QTP88_014823 [Uroleucon formosanum]
MHDEITPLHENETWILVDLPLDKVALRDAWVLKIKYKIDDYHETFSPVVRYQSIRAIFAVAAVEKLIIRQFDIKTAFLYGDLQEEIYMNFFTAFSLQCTESDADAFKVDNSQIILAIFVDDGLIAADNEDINEELLANLEKEFEVKKGNLEYFLAKELSILIDKSHTIEQKEYLEILSEEIPYRQVVGSLLFLSQVTRPDIAYAVNFASRFLEKPTKTHWNLIKRIIWVKYNFMDIREATLCVAIFNGG